MLLKKFFEESPIDMVDDKFISFVTTKDLLKIIVQFSIKNTHMDAHRADLFLRCVVALFSRHHNSEDIHCQIKYLKHGNMSLFKRNLLNKLLTDELQKAMISPFSTLSHKHQILEVWHEDKIETHLVDFMPELEAMDMHEFMRSVLTQWNDEDWHVRNAALKIITTFLLNYKTIDVKKVIPLLLDNLDGTNISLYAASLETIIKLSVVLERSDIVDIIPVLLAGLDFTADNVAHCLASSMVLNAIPMLSAKLDSADIQAFIPTLLVMLVDTHRDIAAAVLQAIEAILPRLEKEDNSALFLYLSDKLRAEQYSSPEKWMTLRKLQKVACKAICILYPLFNSNEMMSFFRILLEHNYVYDIRGEVLEALNVIALTLNNADFASALLLLEENNLDNDKQMLVLYSIKAFCSRLEHTDIKKLCPRLLANLENAREEERETSLKIIEMLSSKLEQDDIQSFINPIYSSLNHSATKVQNAASSVFRALLPIFEQAEVEQLNSLLLDDLAKIGTRQRQRSLKTITTLSDKFEKYDVQMFISSIFSCLDDSDSGVRTAAVSALTSLFPRLAPADIQPFIPLLLENLTNIEPRVRVAALQIIKALSLQFNSDDIEAFLPSLLQCCRETDVSVWEAAFLAFNAVSPKIEQGDASELVAPLLEKIKNNDPIVNEKALQTIVALSPIFESADIRTCLPRVLTMLSAPDLSMFIKAAKALCVFSSKLDRADFYPFIQPLLVRLQTLPQCAISSMVDVISSYTPKFEHADIAKFAEGLSAFNSVRGHFFAVYIIPALSSKIESTHVNALFPLLLNVLRNDRMRAEAVGTFIKLLPKLDNTQISEFISLLPVIFNRETHDSRALMRAINCISGLSIKNELFADDIKQRLDRPADCFMVAAVKTIFTQWHYISNPASKDAMHDLFKNWQIEELRKSELSPNSLCP